MSHPEMIELARYTMGDLSASRIAEIEAHVETCDACATSLQREAQIDQALHAAENNDACPGCERKVTGARCDHCGAANRVAEFRILEVRVQNQHGRLYLAEDADGNRLALKELCFMQAPSFEALDAFEREARILCALDHRSMPKFVKSFQHGEGVHTRLYLAQEFIDGESLEERLAGHYFDEKEVLSIARQVLHILVFLQQRSPMVIHRDVKPANLIVRPDGAIVLVDFGAARDQGSTAGATQVGTFGYMPVEQLAGIVDATTDVYALGVSLARLLTRREAWKLTDDSWGRMNISAPLRRVLQRMMARRSEDRYPSANAALAAFDTLERPTRKRLWPGFAAAAIACVAVAGGVAAFQVNSKPDKQPAYTPVRSQPRTPRAEEVRKPVFGDACARSDLRQESTLIAIARALKNPANVSRWKDLMPGVSAYRRIVESSESVPYTLEIVDRFLGLTDPRGHVSNGKDVTSIAEHIHLIDGDASVVRLESSIVIATGSIHVDGPIKNSIVIVGGCIDTRGIEGSLVIAGATIRSREQIQRSILGAPIVVGRAEGSRIYSNVGYPWQPLLQALLAVEVPITPREQVCDEVSCVLDNYEGECCRKYHKGTVPPVESGLPEAIDRPMIVKGVAPVKSAVMICGDKTTAKGLVKVTIKVNPDGTIANASVKTTPDPVLGECVLRAMKRARFAETQAGGTFSYPFMF